MLTQKAVGLWPGAGVCQINAALLTGVFYPFLRGLGGETILQYNIVVINKILDLLCGQHLI